MRIIGGKLKGKKVALPQEYKARPTTDFAKEGLFNALENEFDFTNTSLLDLFGGTGCISAEFVSRGGAGGVCVEMNSVNSSFISRMLRSLGISTVKVVHCNVFDFLELCTLQFDFIFADPPYNLEALDTIPDKVLSRNILTDFGYFILEHPAEYSFKEHPQFVKEKKYGNVHFSFFKKCD